VRIRAIERIDIARCEVKKSLERRAHNLMQQAAKVNRDDLRRQQGALRTLSIERGLQSKVRSYTNKRNIQEGIPAVQGEKLRSITRLGLHYKTRRVRIR